MKGKLFIVATPIGNLEDMTFRAVRTLKESDLVLCENARNSGKLLSHYEISTNRMSLFEGKGKDGYDWIIEKLGQGENISYISDAGTPAISDPGSGLVRAVRSAGFEIIPIPGPSALVTLISIAGVQANPCHYLGFLSEKKVRRQKDLEVFRSEDCILVFYESVHRIESSLGIAREVFPEAEIYIGRELTKIHEECILWKPGQEFPNFIRKGEFVVLINNHRKKIAKDGIEFSDIMN